MDEVKKLLYPDFIQIFRKSFHPNLILIISWYQIKWNGINIVIWQDFFLQFYKFHESTWSASFSRFRRAAAFFSSSPFSVLILMTSDEILLRKSFGSDFFLKRRDFDFRTSQVSERIIIFSPYMHFSKIAKFWVRKW